jgi:hypothetical protein
MYDSTRCFSVRLQDIKNSRDTLILSQQDWSGVCDFFFRIGVCDYYYFLESASVILEWLSPGFSTQPAALESLIGIQPKSDTLQPLTQWTHKTAQWEA